MKVEHMLQGILDLYKSAELDHGTIDGVRMCGKGSELEAFRNRGHGCLRCLARERLELVEEALKR